MKQQLNKVSKQFTAAAEYVHVHVPIMRLHLLCITRHCYVITSSLFMSQLSVGQRDSNGQLLNAFTLVLLDQLSEVHSKCDKMGVLV